jgi:hypothetical protein
MKNFFSVVVLVILGLALLGKCVGSGPSQSEIETEIDKMEAEERDSGQAVETVTEGFAIAAPSDPNASYRILKISKMSNGNIEVISRRDGTSGTSYARREIDCNAYKYRYLGEGDALAEAEQDSSNIGNMSELTGTSASSDVANAACKKGTR